MTGIQIDTEVIIIISSYHCIYLNNNLLGFGFVTFEKPGPAEKVCSIQFHDIKGKKVWGYEECFCMYWLLIIQ